MKQNPNQKDQSIRYSKARHPESPFKLLLLPPRAFCERAHVCVQILTSASKAPETTALSLLESDMHPEKGNHDGTVCKNLKCFPNPVPQISTPPSPPSSIPTQHTIASRRASRAEIRCKPRRMTRCLFLLFVAEFAKASRKPEAGVKRQGCLCGAWVGSASSSRAE